MSLFRFFIVPFLITILVACQEDVDPVSVPSHYRKLDVEMRGDFRFFTSRGEIMQRPTSDNISRDVEQVEYDFSHLLYPRNMDSIRFPNKQEAVLNHRYSNLHCSFSTKGNRLILTETEAGRKCCTTDETFTRSIAYLLGEVKHDVVSEYVISSAFGIYTFGYVGRERFVMMKSGGDLVAPMIQYVYRSGNRIRIGTINNLLQRDFYKHLEEGDTLTLLESHIIYERQQ